MSKRKQNQTARDEGSHFVEKNKKFHIFAFILCVLIAFVIWLYASNLEKNNKDETNVTNNTQTALIVRLPETL